MLSCNVYIIIINHKKIMNELWTINKQIIIIYIIENSAHVGSEFGSAVTLLWVC